MARTRLQPWSQDVWELARRQHGVVARGQLLELGVGAEAIDHRLGSGRLHRLCRGIYAVGRPETSRYGRLIAAVLSCGPTALVSHGSAGWLWGIATWTPEIHVVMPNGVVRSYPGITAHRRLGLGEKDRREVASIPVTDPANTLIDMACGLPDSKLERAIREADRLDLVDPERLRARLDTSPQRPGIGRLRKLLDSETFALTDSELERRFLRLIATADLPLPKTQVWLNGYRVDFYWPELGLVVETDGLRYHRTPSQQKKDRLRDQAHAAAGLIPLRFTAAQVRFESKQMMATLIAVASRLQSTR